MDSKIKLKYSILIFISLLMAGCGTSKPVNVKLTSPDLYIGPENILKKEIKIAFGELKISPSIPSNNIIGRAKTGMFNVTADLVADEPISIIVSKFLKKGFEQAGFRIVDLKDSSYIVQGSIEKFWVDEHATGLSFEYAKAYVRYDLILKKINGDIAWANTIEKFKVSRKSLDSSSSMIPTLTLALRDSVESIFEDQSFWKAIYK